MSGTIHRSLLLLEERSIERGMLLDEAMYSEAFARVFLAGDDRALGDVCLFIDCKVEGSTEFSRIARRDQFAPSSTLEDIYMTNGHLTHDVRDSS